MDRVEELITVRTSAAHALDVLLTTGNLRRWAAPDISVTPLTVATRLGPGDRFRIHVLGPLQFDYTVEAASEREVVFAFKGPWRGSERWSFIADGAETIVRRVHEVYGGSIVKELAWNTVGRLAVIAHFKLELARFRDLAEREPGAGAEIEAPDQAVPLPGDPGKARPQAPDREPPEFPVDDG
jgi:hypothetical protein